MFTPYSLHRFLYNNYAALYFLPICHTYPSFSSLFFMFMALSAFLPGEFGAAIFYVYGFECFLLGVFGAAIFYVYGLKWSVLRWSVDDATMMFFMFMALSAFLLEELCELVVKTVSKLAYMQLFSSNLCKEHSSKSTQRVYLCFCLITKEHHWIFAPLAVPSARTPETSRTQLSPSALH